jgi:hypothetical protein
MKKIIFLLALFAITVPAQTQDSVDIRAIVQKQIDSARERDRNEQLKRDSLANVKVYYGPEPLYYGCEPEPKPVKNDSLLQAKNAETLLIKENKKIQQAKENLINTNLLSAKKAETKSSNSFLWKFYLLAGVSLVAFTFVYIRRLLLKRSLKPANDFKNNIKTIRDENLIKRDRPQLKLIRSKLVNSPVILNNHGKSLPTVARELNISQGEIILAAKIKSYELAKNENNKWFLN